MRKGYWITFYRSVSNPAALTAYGKAAGSAIAAGGGRFLVRGTPAKAYEEGLNQRCVVIEFDSLEKAIVTYESPDYQAAKKLLEGSVAGRANGRGRLAAGQTVTEACCSPALGQAVESARDDTRLAHANWRAASKEVARMRARPVVALGLSSKLCALLSV